MSDLNWLIRRGALHLHQESDGGAQAAHFKAQTLLVAKPVLL